MLSMAPREWVENGCLVVVAVVVIVAAAVTVAVFGPFVAGVDDLQRDNIGVIGVQVHVDGYTVEQWQGEVVAVVVALVYIVGHLLRHSIGRTEYQSAVLSALYKSPVRLNLPHKQLDESLQVLDW